MLGELRYNREGMQWILTSLLVYVLLIPTLSGCRAGSRSSPSSEPRAHLEHRVQYPGETFHAIALWYTGSGHTAAEIARVNSDLQSPVLTPGAIVLIPRYLIKRNSPMPKGFVASASVKKRGASSHPSQPSSASSPNAAAPNTPPSTSSAPQSEHTHAVSSSPESEARRRKVLQELLEQ